MNGTIAYHIRAWSIKPCERGSVHVAQDMFFTD